MLVVGYVWLTIVVELVGARSFIGKVRIAVSGTWFPKT